ncbi:MAG: hypothetical protein K9K65_14675 [Desulfarculaceae bacterium]|nr:hypothetical protein [Desulfarculaceae bacterium]MCF8099084.1 hypothetical protein [Desulfarculaceae bacterium]MCF8124035.1 hypothetical protein [Desulfarculaceae bacterium]
MQKKSVVASNRQIGRIAVLACLAVVTFINVAYSAGDLRAAQEARGKFKDAIRERVYAVDKMIDRIDEFKSAIKKVMRENGNNEALVKKGERILSKADYIQRKLKSAKGSLLTSISRLTDAPVIGNWQNSNDIYNYMKAEAKRVENAMAKAQRAAKEFQELVASLK